MAPDPSIPEAPVQSVGAFVRAGVIVAALVALGAAAAYAVSERVAPVYPEGRARLALLEAHGAAVEAVALGNSHNRAIDFEALGVEGFHLWLQGSDLMESARLFADQRALLPNLDVVTVTVPLFTADNAARPDRHDRRLGVYATTRDYRPLTDDARLAFRARLAPIVRTDNWEGVFEGLVGRRAGPPVLPNGYIDDGQRDDRQTPAQIARSARLHAERHLELQAASHVYNPDLCADARAALEALVDLAGGARVVLFTPPYDARYAGRLEDAADTCALDAFAETLAERAGVVYVDARQTPGFTPESGLFANADHLNGAGARRFADLLRPYVAPE